MAARWQNSENYVPPISAAEIFTERSIAEFLSWMNDIHERLDAGEGHRAWLRHDTGDGKIFSEEIMPFEVFVRAEETDLEARVVFPPDDGPADAILREYRKDGSDQPMQITTTYDYEEALRMEKLTSGGGPVSGFGPMWREEKRAGFGKGIRDSLEAYQLEYLAGREAAKVVDRIIRKKTKTNYPPETWLLVMFGDYLNPFNERYRDIIFAAAEYAADNSVFERVYLVGKLDPPYAIRVKPTNDVVHI